MVSEFNDKFSGGSWWICTRLRSPWGEPRLETVKMLVLDDDGVAQGWCQAGEQIRPAADPTPTQKLTDPGVVQPRPYIVNPRRPLSHVDSLTARRGEATYLPLCNTRSGLNEVLTPGVLTR